MKVKDLINYLEQADPEHEVFASPLTFMPSLESSVKEETFEDESYDKAPNPLKKYSVENVGLYTSVYGDDKGSQYVFLGYETDEKVKVFKKNEFIN